MSPANLTIKHVLISLYKYYRYKPEFVMDNLTEWEAFVDYLHTFWISNGIYHYQTEEKIPVRFSQDFFDLMINDTEFNRWKKDKKSKKSFYFLF